MSHWNKVGKLASSSSCSLQKSGAGLGTLANMGKKGSWEPIGNDHWGSNKDKEYKTMSTVAYAKKLQGEEELRAHTKAFQVQIVKQIPKKTSWKAIYNDL